MSDDLHKKIKYLWVYSASNKWVVSWHERLIKRRRERGYDVIGFCNTPLSMQRRWLPFPELDRRWKGGDPKLLSMYESLLDCLFDRDVLILYNGANLHPEFVKLLSILKVYSAGDDPESTEILTKPIAPAFDIHLVNNIACLGMYRSWGLKNVYFWPLGSLSTIDDVSDLTEESIIDVSKRKIPIVFLGGVTAWRKKRQKELMKYFPNAFVAGRGQPRGYISWNEMWQTYRNSQIGWNIHNSSGPINFRTYELPAYGVMQICDNKANLGKIYQLDKEVVGFDNINECIEKTHYYLDNKEEQREIALAGWCRWKKDYHPDQIWEVLINVVGKHYFENLERWRTSNPNEIKNVLKQKQNSGYFMVSIRDRITDAMSRVLKKI
ncbi:MAG: Spore protein YkvP [Syntrophorhabdus sp. PtaB.Bin027]|nr:MAG: Spore protein YkvP [Syntrophorhabdus sp. PtaB.Bin027]